jgi:hypothetical protein
VATSHAARIGKKTRKEIYDVLERLEIGAGEYRQWPTRNRSSRFGRNVRP